MRSLLRLIIVPALVAWTACVTPVPQALEPQHIPALFSAPTAPNAPVWPSPDWWRGFGSPELDSLITAARTGNLDLAAAAARVLEARAQSRIAGAALFPSVSLQGSAQRSRIGQGGVSTTANAFGLSADASYQADLWGRARADERSAVQLALASRYAQETVALTVTGDVANTYLDVLALRQRLGIARQNAAAAQRILTTVQAKVRDGVSSQLDLAQQQTQLATIEATIPALEEQEQEARYSLALLLGRVPEGFDVRGATIDSIVAPEVAPGLPSELLRRRPDVAQAEANLASVHANVDAARAALFPEIGLTGSAGVASTALSTLFTSTGFVWSLGASLVQTIFDGGSRKGQLELSRAQQQEFVASYRRAALNAFVDVETALSQVSSLAEQERRRSVQATSAAEAFRIAEVQYREGVTDLLNVLTAQQTLFSAQDQFVQVKLARVQAVVGLYQALGGGWSESSDVATQTAP